MTCRHQWRKPEATESVFCYRPGKGGKLSLVDVAVRRVCAVCGEVQYRRRAGALEPDPNARFGPWIGHAAYEAARAIEKDRRAAAAKRYTERARARRAAREREAGAGA